MSRDTQVMYVEELRLLSERLKKMLYTEGHISKRDLSAQRSQVDNIETELINII